MRKDESRRGQAAHTLPRRQFLLNIGLKNHSLRAVCTFHTRIFSVNGHHLAGILGVKNVGTPYRDELLACSQYPLLYPNMPIIQELDF